MTSERVAVLGTGLIGTSVAMAALRAGDDVVAFDPNPAVLRRAVERAPGTNPAESLAACVASATLTFVCTPVDQVATTALAALEAGRGSIVTDVAGVKSHVMLEVERGSTDEQRSRFVGGHPMGGSERSGPDAASASILDGAVWVLTPGADTAQAALDRLSSWIQRIGARPVVMDAGRHDRLVAFVSHLPQVASTALMAVAAGEEAGEPDILLLAAGGFRDLTRLAASNPRLWSEILLANRDAIADAIDRYAKGLLELRDAVAAGLGEEVESTFAAAKEARLSLAAKPQVKTGVAVLQVPVPDRPGVLAELAAALGAADVNIEDLQIVHSPEGGRGTVHLTVAASAADAATRALSDGGFEPLRLA
ncbi:MAG: prephenate dehydrogenase [Actinomycetota bacterium]